LLRQSKFFHHEPTVAYGPSVHTASSLHRRGRHRSLTSFIISSCPRRTGNLRWAGRLLVVTQLDESVHHRVRRRRRRVDVLVSAYSAANVQLAYVDDVAPASQQKEQAQGEQGEEDRQGGRLLGGQLPELAEDGPLVLVAVAAVHGHLRRGVVVVLHGLAPPLPPAVVVAVAAAGLVVLVGLVVGGIVRGRIVHVVVLPNVVGIVVVLVVIVGVVVAGVVIIVGIVAAVAVAAATAAAATTTAAATAGIVVVSVVAVAAATIAIVVAATS
jgi:hypothetical protein